jgi:hypothetical protein
MTSDDETADSAPTSAGIGPSDETTAVPPPTAAAPELAWSQAESDPLRQSWGQVWSAVAIVLLCCGAVAMGITAWALLRSGSAPYPSHGPTMTVTAAPPTTVAVAQPPPALGAASDDQFIAKLRRAGIQIYDPQSAIKTARYVCAQLARGLGYNAIAANIGNPATLTGAQATILVDDSVLFYCPQSQEPESLHGE